MKKLMMILIIGLGTILSAEKASAIISVTWHQADWCWGKGTRCDITIGFITIGPKDIDFDVEIPAGATLAIMKSDKWNGREFTEFTENYFPKEATRESTGILVPAQKTVYSSKLGGYVVYYFRK